jgi:hypothetical protein
LFSCAHNQNHEGGLENSQINLFTTPQSITIEGECLDFISKKKKFQIDINQIVFGQKTKYAYVDRLGKFSVTFDSYTSVDIFFRTFNHYMLVAHPKDTIRIKIYNNQSLSESREQLYFHGVSPLTNMARKKNSKKQRL